MRTQSSSSCFYLVYSPWHNKIEKLWHALHETRTRNHFSVRTWMTYWSRYTTLWTQRLRSQVASMA